MNGHIGGTRRIKPHSEGEIEQFNLLRDREGEEAINAIELLAERGLSAGPWRLVLRALARPVGQACLELVKATHHDSPGGGKVTRAELRAIGKRLADRVGRGFEKEFADAIVEDAA